MGLNSAKSRSTHALTECARVRAYVRDWEALSKRYIAQLNTATRCFSRSPMDVGAFHSVVTSSEPGELRGFHLAPLRQTFVMGDEQQRSREIAQRRFQSFNRR